MAIGRIHERNRLAYGQTDLGAAVRKSSVSASQFDRSVDRIGRETLGDYFTPSCISPNHKKVDL